MAYPRVLFILKKRECYGCENYSDPCYERSISSGLLNSARMVVEMLVKNGVPAAYVQVTDNNDIDREVTKYRPDICIIEALWVVPSKFEILQRLHPKVEWIIRVHSELPFLAQEGIAMQWLLTYLDYSNVAVSFNSEKTDRDFRVLIAEKYGRVGDERVYYLPNYYPVSNNEAPYVLDEKDMIDVASFGAVRPMKNQLIQAVAAVEYARKHHLGLRFHINGNRKEAGGDNPYKNLKQLFANLDPQYQLVEHPWLVHSAFLELVETMDIGLQMSLSETFNIVAADFVSQGVPVVTSAEIKFVSGRFHADPTNAQDIVEKMERALFWKRYLGWLDVNKHRLKGFSAESERIWLKFLQ